MMSKAGVSPPQPLGTAIPTPEGCVSSRTPSKRSAQRIPLTIPSLPHASPPQNGHLSSSPTGQPIPFPLKEGGGLARRPSVGVGMPQPINTEGMAVPGANHQRRGSER